MPSDFISTPEDFSTDKESESPMFAPVPAWERGKKRRGFGGSRASRVAPDVRAAARRPVRSGHAHTALRRLGAPSVAAESSACASGSPRT